MKYFLSAFWSVSILAASSSIIDYSLFEWLAPPILLLYVSLKLIWSKGIFLIRWLLIFGYLFEIYIESFKLWMTVPLVART